MFLSKSTTEEKGVQSLKMRILLFFSVFDGNDVIQNSVNGKACKRFDAGFDGDVFAVGNDSMGT